jgi:hypothetical protein
LASDPTPRAIASAGGLTQLTLDKADAVGVGCCFETAGEKTRTLCEKRGFRVRDEPE